MARTRLKEASNWSVSPAMLDWTLDRRLELLVASRKAVPLMPELRPGKNPHPRRAEAAA